MVCRFIRPPSPSHHLAVRSRRGGSGCQTRSLRSQLLCHAADKTSMHISLKEREDLRDFRSLSLSSFLEFPLFVHLPSPPFFFFLHISFTSTDSAAHRLYFTTSVFPLSFKHFLQSFFFFFLVSLTSQSGIDGIAQTLKVTEGEEVSKLREPPTSRLRERRAINCSSCFDFPDWKCRSSLMEQLRCRQLTVSCRRSLAALQARFR